METDAVDFDDCDCLICDEEEDEGHLPRLRRTVQRGVRRRLPIMGRGVLIDTETFPVGRGRVSENCGSVCSTGATDGRKDRLRYLWI